MEIRHELKSKNNKTKKLYKDFSASLEKVLGERSFVMNFKEQNQNKFGTQKEGNFFSQRRFFNSGLIRNCLYFSAMCIVSFSLAENKKRSKQDLFNSLASRLWRKKLSLSS